MIDTHAHLDHLENTDQSLKEAASSGVEGIMAVSVDLESMKQNLQIKRSVQTPEIYLALGLHPGNLKTEEIAESLKFIHDHISEAHAVGEIGMDFWYKWVRKDKAKKDEQREMFCRQLALANKYDLPAIIHTRGTWAECVDVVKKMQVKRALFHWYSGPLDVLDDILSSGYYISATPSIAYSPQSRQAIEHAPIEQTLIETDCPVFYRTSEAGDGFMATPKDIKRTLSAYARLKNMDEQLASDVLNGNARKFFALN